MTILENIKKNQPSRNSRSGDSPIDEGSLRINDYYQPTPRRSKKESHKHEARVDLPHFHGKKTVETYLDWEMNVEQLFTCHQVSKERKVPLATLKLSKFCVSVDFPRKR